MAKIFIPCFKSLRKKLYSENPELKCRPGDRLISLKLRLTGLKQPFITDQYTVLYWEEQVISKGLSSTWQDTLKFRSNIHGLPYRNLL